MAKVNPYGDSDWGGLFEAQGNTLSDVRAKISQEREAKVRQAYADVISGGGSIAAGRQAKAIEQQNQLFQGIAQNLFGSEDGMISQDPRLAKAVKRDKDRKEVVSILGTYTDPNSPGGSEISEQEMKMGFSELMKRGYVKEAKEFLAMAQSMGGQRRADVTSGLEQDKFKWKKIVDDKTLTQGDIKLRLNELQTKHNIKIDYEKLGVSKDDLKLQGDIAFAKIAWDKEKNNRAQGEVERSNLAREALTSRGYDINEDGNVIKREQLKETERMNTARIGNMEKDIKLRSRVQDFNEDFKNRSFGWQKKMDELNADLKKQGLEIRREGNRIQLVGIETRAATAKEGRKSQEKMARNRINANLTMAEKRIISAEKLSNLDRQSREEISKARDKTSLEIANIKSKPKQKEIKTVTDKDRDQILSYIKGTPGLEEKMKSALGQTAWYDNFRSINSNSVAILTSKAKTVQRHYSNANQYISLNQALDLLVSDMTVKEREDVVQGKDTSKKVPEVIIEEIKE